MLSACAGPRISVDRAVVHNATPGVIIDVKVLHQPTGKTGSVNKILPNRSLNLGFSKQPMLAKEAIVTWQDHNGQQRKIRVSLPYDREAAWGKQEMSLIYTIHPSGKVTVELNSSHAN